MSIESIVSGFRELSADEKIRLVQEFWDEIAKGDSLNTPRTFVSTMARSSTGEIR